MKTLVYNATLNPLYAPSPFNGLATEVSPKISRVTNILRFVIITNSQYHHTYRPMFMCYRRDHMRSTDSNSSNETCQRVSSTRISLAARAYRPTTWSVNSTKQVAYWPRVRLATTTLSSSGACTRAVRISPCSWTSIRAGKTSSRTATSP